MSSSTSTAAMTGTEASGIVVERYKYILQQIHTVNENVYRFLAIYQAIATALATAAIILVVNYPTWKVAPDLARTGLYAFALLATAVAVFTVVMIAVGILSWIDYRGEECELTQTYLPTSFRQPPRLRNFYRWYETYVILFVLVLTVLLWVAVIDILLPHIV